MSKGRGYITNGQKRFLKALARDGRHARQLLEEAVGKDGAVDFLSESAASSLIGSIQAARSPRPALRKSAVREISEAEAA